MVLRGAEGALWSASGVNEGAGCCICVVTLGSPYAQWWTRTADLYRVKIRATANCRIYKAWSLQEAL